MQISIQSNLYRYLFQNVYFITGTAYAGKSTMVRMLADAYDGIQCDENYHDRLMDAVQPQYQPNLCYFQTMSGWQEFISRTPEAYDAWITGGSREAAELELLLLTQKALDHSEKKIFVDTNIPLEILHEIAVWDHVAVMLAPQEMSVNRFFDREDADKQFIYQRILEAPDPDAALAHYRKILEKCNSPEHYREYAESGFFVFRRREDSTISEAFSAITAHFRL